MLKSTAGGGGIGLQLVPSADEIAPMFERVERLARNNFKDAGIFVEKYVARGRHIEVQIFGDGKGTRRCARRTRLLGAAAQPEGHRGDAGAQSSRRDARARFGTRRGALGQSVNYESAGTVEFLYDAETDEFYFLEVNTRLQVEHGVTEEVTGVDLVEWMVRQAAGELCRLRAGAHQAARRIDPGAPLCRRSRPRLPPELRPADARRVASRCARRDLGRERHRRSRPSTIRCWPRSSSRARRATKRSADCRRRSTARASAGSRPTSTIFASCRGIERLRTRRSADANAADLRLQRRDDRGAGAGHADDGAGLARPPRLLGGRRAAVRADGRALVPPRQPDRRQ